LIFCPDLLPWRHTANSPICRFPYSKFGRFVSSQWLGFMVGMTNIGVKGVEIFTKMVFDHKLLCREVVSPELQKRQDLAAGQVSKIILRLMLRI